MNKLLHDDYILQQTKLFYQNIILSQIDKLNAEKINLIEIKNNLLTSLKKESNVAKIENQRELNNKILKKITLSV